MVMARGMGGMQRGAGGRLLVVFLFVYLATAAAPAEGRRQRKLGYFFTRSRGRCTPQYWSSRREAWPRMTPPESTVSKVFGSRASERYRHDLTLLESMAGLGGGDTFGRLLRQGTAALLNSYSRRGFPYTGWEVKTLLIQGMVSRNAALRQARRFAIANEACD